MNARKRKAIVFLLLLAMAIAAYLLWPTDESRIRKLVREGAKAAESGDADGVMAKISFSYRDGYGLTYLSLKEILKRELPRLSDISIEYEHLNVQVSENTAAAELDIRVVATSGNETGYIIGDARAPVLLRLTLEKERAKWLITGLEGVKDQRMRSSAR